MSLIVPTSPNHSLPSYQEVSAEEHCVALALHICHAAAVHLHYHIPDQPLRHWSAFRSPNEPDELGSIPGWAKNLGNKRLIAIPDTHAAPELNGALPRIRDSAIRSLVRIHIQSDPRRPRGTLWVLDTVPHQFTTDDLAALDHLVQIMTMALAATKAIPPAIISPESAAPLHVLLQNATDLVSINDAQGVVRYISPSVTRILGYQPEELIGRSSFDFLHPDDIAVIRAGASEAAKHPGSHKPIHMRFRDIHGHWRILEASNTNMLDDPYVRGIVVNARDITEQVHAEQKQQASETRFLTMFRTAPLGMVVVNEQGQMLLVNPAFAELFGYQVKDLDGQLLDVVLSDHQRMVHKQHVVQFHAKPMVRSMRALSNLVGRHVDGTLIAIDVSLSMFTHAGEQFAMAFVIDMRARKQEQAALQKSEQFAKVIADNIPGMLGYWNRDLRCTFANKEYLEWFGRTPEQMQGLQIQELLGAELFRKNEPYIRAALRGEDSQFERTLIKTNGEVRHTWAQYIAHRINGEVHGFFALVTDITALKQNAEQLRISDTTLKAISQGVLMTGLDQRIISVNDAFTSITGYDQASIQGKKPVVLQGPRTNPQVAMAMRLALDAGKEFAGEILNYRKNGTPFWNELTISPVHDEHGTLTNFVGIIRDITEQKQAQAALIATETRFRTVIDVSPIPMGINDDQQNITFLNRAFVQTFGYTQAMIPTLTDWWTNAYPDPQYRRWVMDTWVAKLEYMQQSGGTFSPMEVTVRCNDGTNKIVLANAALISNDVADDHLVVLYDITAQKQAEAEQAKLEAQLYQAQKMESIGRLAGGVAHDFNNMLGVILGHTELALDEIDPSLPIHVDLAEIWKAAQRSATLTRQLLAFARKQAAAPKTLDLNETVSGTLTMLDRMIGENIDLVWVPAIDLWSVKIDPTQIDQILANLCVNARDAIITVGQITIETGNRIFDVEYCADHTDCIPGEYVLLSVRDNGYGMSQDVQEHLFEPFFTTKPLGQGTGLGLATVYGIVKQNNGFIHVASELGQGTTFQIYLPRHITIGSAAADTEVARPTLGGGETILLVEDEPAILKLGSTMLTRLGYHVMTAGAPSIAIQIAETYAGEIHLLMTDVVMPEMNGRNLAAHLLARHPRLKRLFMSGYTDEIIAHHGVLEEGVFFIQKPFSLKDLAAKVREVIEYGTAH